MKTLNSKAKIARIGGLIAACAVLSAPVSVLHLAHADPAGDDIFAVNIGAHEAPTPEQQEQINKIAGAARFKLQMALKDTKNEAPSDALPAFVNQVCDVLADSAKVSRGSELLFRIVLVQGMELVHGVPADKTCQSLKKGPVLDPGLLGAGAGERLKEQLSLMDYQILRDSAELAINLAETESQIHERVATGLPVGALDLPYEELAYFRVEMSQFWNQSVAFLGSRMEYVHLRAAFQQWLTIITNDNVAKKLDYSAVIKRTQQALAATALPGGVARASLSDVQHKTRRLRRHMAEMISELTPRFFGNDAFKPKRVSDVTSTFGKRFAYKFKLAKEAEPERKFKPAYTPVQPMGEITWSYAGSYAAATAGKFCLLINEPSDPHDWQDNYLCFDRDYGFQWSFAGAIAGMKCTQVNEPSDPHNWQDNYLCAPANTDYQLQWSYSGPIAGMDCTLVNEPSDPDAWQDNYLCKPRPVASN